MKAFLLYRNRDFDLLRNPPQQSLALIADLELNTLFNSMALGDAFLFEWTRRIILSSLETDLETIRHRQAIMRDCMKNPDLIRCIYNISVEAIEKEKKVFFGIFGKHPGTVLHRSIEVMQLFVEILQRLRYYVDEHAHLFNSEGFTTLFAMLDRELSDEYFATIQRHLKELRFRGGVLISAELSKGNKGAAYILRKPHDRKGWKDRIFAQRPPEFSFAISDRDESGARALSELKEEGMNLVANALAQSTDHILSFFAMLRAELGFYVGCINLYEQLSELGEPICFPLPAAANERRHSFEQLADVCLTLTQKKKVVGNDANADNRDLVIITGANQGGKSTFLRSVGLAQLMMQAGMFVPAMSFCSSICDGIFTHFRREEDATMTRGKLDEELSRMSEIVDQITTHPILLFNESFAATNDREGSEIARQIVTALFEKRIRVFFVTHLFDFAHAFYQRDLDRTLFLRAERQEDGARTFRLIEGEPLQTSFGEDLFIRVFVPETRFPEGAPDRVATARN